MIFTERAVGTTHNGYYQVSFKPVTLEWHELMHKEGLQRFSQVYYSTFKSLPQVVWTWMNILHCFCLCISFHQCIIVEPWPLVLSVIDWDYSLRTYLAVSQVSHKFWPGNEARNVTKLSSFIPRPSQKCLVTFHVTWGGAPWDCCNIRAKRASHAMPHSWVGSISTALVELLHICIFSLGLDLNFNSRLKIECPYVLYNSSAKSESESWAWFVCLMEGRERGRENLKGIGVRAGARVSLLSYKMWTSLSSLVLLPLMNN